jgi:pilus assembly protein TadC
LTTHALAPGNRLARWLARAGHRRPDAVRRFALATACTASLGFAAALFFYQLPGARAGALALASLPVVGPSFGALARALPWLAGAALAATPFWLVRARYNARAAAIEEDLPFAIELIAALARAGLGFDAALDGLIASEPAARPLVQELVRLRADLRSGRPRVDCLRRLAERTGVPAVRSVSIALVQAEQTGSSAASVLPLIAEELRLARRERLLARAEALPEKLVFPLTLGFLPGLLLFSLGPSIHQLLRLLDGVFGAGG